jgi:hypothetical protein
MKNKQTPPPRHGYKQYHLDKATVAQFLFAPKQKSVKVVKKEKK